MASRLLVASGLSREILTLAQYARLRLKRLELARARRFRELEALNRRLRYGFWTDPLRLREHLHPLRESPYLADPEAFERLLFPEERARLLCPGQAGEYYLGWLRLPPFLMEPWAFEEALRAQEEKGRALPLFLNAFHLGPGGREGPWRGR